MSGCPNVMRYYVYVSPTKIEQLVAQIPDNALGRIAKTLTIDLKVVRAEFREKEQSGNTYSALQVVEKYLDEQKAVGTVDEPRSYFRGTLSMRWGPFSGVGSGVVYFGGESEHTVLGLGGSRTSLIGSVGESHPGAASATPYLVAALQSELDIGVEGMPDSRNADPRASRYSLMAAYLAATRMVGPTQRLEFLAKRLIWSGSDSGDAHAFEPAGKQVLLGTPLFVSMLD